MKLSRRYARHSILAAGVGVIMMLVASYTKNVTYMYISVVFIVGGLVIKFLALSSSLSYVVLIVAGVVPLLNGLKAEPSTALNVVRRWSMISNLGLIHLDENGMSPFYSHFFDLRL